MHNEVSLLRYPYFLFALQQARDVRAAGDAPHVRQQQLPAEGSAPPNLAQLLSFVCTLKALIQPHL